MTLAVLAVALYAVLGLTAAVLVARARQSVREELLEHPNISVLVAARNEEEHIGACLEHLAAQSYPRDRIEFILIDDDSTDDTAAIIQRYVAQDDRFTYVSAEPMAGHPPGKAAALTSGIRVATGELLLFTDADCRPPPGWAAGLVSSVRADHLGAVGGVTSVIGRGLHAMLQSIDWTLLKGVAAGWSLAGIPLTAMGNNMVVRRAAYDDVGGFPALRPSVTEDFALFQAIQKAEWPVRLDPHPHLANYTLAEHRFRDVFRQRRRWARGALASSPLATAFYVVIYAAHLLPLLLLPTHPEAAGFMIAAKVLVDALVITSNAPEDKRWSHLLAWPLYEVYLYAYLLILPVSLAVVPAISWKERAHHPASSGGTGV